MAIHWGTQKMRMYLEGYHFVVVIDHLALKCLNRELRLPGSLFFEETTGSGIEKETVKKRWKRI